MRWQHYELWSLLACVRFISASFVKACRIRVPQAIIAALTAKPENLCHIQPLLLLLLLFCATIISSPRTSTSSCLMTVSFRPFSGVSTMAFPQGCWFCRASVVTENSTCPGGNRGQSVQPGRAREIQVYICAGHSVMHYREAFPRGELNLRQGFILIQMQPSRPPRL